MLARDVDIPAVPSVPAPAPALVTIGSDDRGVVLVDLDASGGLTTVAGVSDRVRCVLSSVAVELATSTWAHELSVTMVGFPGVSGLTDSRVSICDSLGEAWPHVERCLTAGPGVLRHAGGSPVRVGGPDSNATMPSPHAIVMASPLSVGERAALEAWLRPSPDRAPLYVIAPQRSPGPSNTDTRGWSFGLDDEGVLSSATLHHRVGAQAISPHAMAAIAELIRHASVEPKTRRGSGSRVVVRSLSDVDIRVLVRLFGMPAASGDVAPGVPLSVEIAAFLALRESASVDELASAIWPFGTSDAECREALRRTQWWLGLDADGLPRLRIDGDMLHLSAEVQVDWTLVMAHAWCGVPMDATTLTSLLRGRPMGSELSSEYSWLAKEPAAHEIESVTVDVCARTAEERLAVGDRGVAAQLLTAGLNVCRDADPLTRLLQRGGAPQGSSSVMSATGEPVLERAGSQ
jgi:hypothetical protein